MELTSKACTAMPTLETLSISPCHSDIEGSAACQRDAKKDTKASSCLMPEKRACSAYKPSKSSGS